MPLSMQVGETWQLTYRTYYPNSQQAGVNIRHFHITSISGTPPTDYDMVLSFYPLLKALYTPLIANTAYNQSLVVQRVDPLPRTYPQQWPNPSELTAGTGGLQPLPGNIAGVITFYTASAGRKYRGRSYIPFPAAVESTPDTAQPTANYVSLLQPLANWYANTKTLIGVANGVATLLPVIWHRLPRTYDLITGARANPRWGSIHRRGNYGRLNPAFA